ncbi:MAG: bifunctional proline dehydrogenase/L-glutamate gamma-semialdehyde dehydrogenase, partial [Planctomycetaceae bacterium]
AVISEPEAEAYQRTYLELIDGLSAQVNDWPENPQIDRDQHGPIPRVNVSLKLSALDSQFKPIDPAGSAEGVKERLRPLLRRARERGAYVHVDMEHYAYKDLTLEIFKQTLCEDEFRDFADVGIVIQAYLPEAEADLHDLLTWVKQRGTPVWVRLVKGAYWDYETVVARYRNWPIPVYLQKWQSDENFERQTRFLMENHEWLRPALGSHNLRSLAHGVACAKHLGIPPGAWEIQMLYGMGAEQAQVFSELGHRVRIYTPFGELIPGMAYLVRRLLENTSNDSFLRQSFAEHVSIEELLMSPTQTGRKTPPPREEPRPEFTNEPHTDFNKAENRARMRAALKEVAGQFGVECPLVIGGQRVETRGEILSRNPADKSQIVGRVAAATAEDAVEAVAAARRAFRHWSRTEPHHRAEYLELAAARGTPCRESTRRRAYRCGRGVLTRRTP